MALSAEETATAKKAFYEMRECDSSRVSLILSGSIILFLVLSFGFFIACGGIVGDNGKDLTGWAAALSVFSVFFHHPVFLLMLLPLPTYLRSKSKYAENLKLVTEIEQKHPGEFRYGLEQEIELPPNQPKRRPLLWRLDAFLSRKPIEK